MTKKKTAPKAKITEKNRVFKVSFSTTIGRVNIGDPLTPELEEYFSKITANVEQFLK